MHILSQKPDSTGSGIYIQAIIKEAAKNGHENYLIAGVPAGATPNLAFIPPENCSFVQFNGKDLPFPIVGMSDVMPYKSTRFSDLSEQQLDLYEHVFSEKIKFMVDKFQPDIIHSHHLWIVTSVARRIAPAIPIVTSCHGSDLRQFKKHPFIAQRVEKYCQLLNGVFALSNIQKQEISALYHIPLQKIHVTGAGYSNSRFSFTEKSEPDPVQIVYAGKISRAKGVPWLLQTLSEIKEPSWLLHLVGGGEGPEKEESVTLAKRLGEKVKIYGAISQQELAAILKKSHLFVLPSFFEGLALVLIEALACGCRLISTNLPGVSEVLGKMDEDYLQLVDLPRLQNLDQPHPSDERLFKHNLKTAFVKQLNRIKTKPKIDESKIKPVLKNFTWERVFKRIEMVYFIASIFLVSGFFVDFVFGQNHVTRQLYQKKIEIRGIYGNPNPLWEKNLKLDQLGVNAIFVHSKSINKKMIMQARQEGVKIFAEFATLNGKGYVKDHPEAWAINEKGEKVQPASWFMGVCPTEPGFKRHRMQELLELLQKFELNGIWLDYLHWHAQFEEPEPILPETCFCNHCLTSFQTTASVKIPDGNTAQKAEWILKNYDSAWRDWRCSVIAEWVKDFKELLNREEPDALLGLYHCPWNDDDFNGARRRNLGLDYDMLKEIVDVFSPMVYHGRMGRSADWVKENIVWFCKRLAIGTSDFPKVWPIVQAYNDPYKISSNEFERVLRNGLSAGATGVMMFTSYAVAEDPKKVEAMKKVYTESAEEKTPH